ncbi:MAG: hypothetical protein QXO86_07460 [Nitrososphaerota archaeon]
MIANKEKLAEEICKKARDSMRLIIGPKLVSERFVDCEGSLHMFCTLRKDAFENLVKESRESFEWLFSSVHRSKMVFPSPGIKPQDSLLFSLHVEDGGLQLVCDEIIVGRGVLKTESGRSVRFGWGGGFLIGSKSGSFYEGYPFDEWSEIVLHRRWSDEVVRDHQLIQLFSDAERRALEEIIDFLEYELGSESFSWYVKQGSRKLDSYIFDLYFIDEGVDLPFKGNVKLHAYISLFAHEMLP